MQVNTLYTNTLNEKNRKEESDVVINYTRKSTEGNAPQKVTQVKS